MAIPLNYQISEFDCGPTSLLNALNIQFDRSLIQPSVIKAVYTYTLDSCDSCRRPGQHGTSAAALRFIGEWLNDYGEKCGFPIRCESLAPEDIRLEPGSPLVAALENGAVAVTRCLLHVGHYILLTGVEGESCLFWDPYHLECAIRKKGIRMIDDQPCRCNRRATFAQMNPEGRGYYNLGEREKRECLLVYNTQTRREW